MSGINLIQDEGCKKPTSPPPPPSTNIGIIPQSFLTFSFNPFAKVVLSFRAIPRASHKLLNLNQDHLSKK